MILAIGLVVDDAIVVVERVQYLMKNRQMTSSQASAQAIKDIASSVVATTLVLMAIFIPVGLMAGMTGKIYQQFAVTRSTAVFFSAVNALTLSPALCSIFLTQKSNKQFRWMTVFNAFLDTGNKLKVAYLNKSIVLVDKDKIEDIDMQNPIYVPYSSLNNHGLLECYKCLKLEIDGKIYDKFLLGISNEKFYIDGIDCIINNSVMEGLK